MWVQRILTILERPSLCLSDHCCVEFSVLVDFACDASIFSSYRYYSWRRADYIGINNYSQNLTGLNFFATSQVLLICGLPLLVLFFMPSPSMFPPKFHVIVYPPKSMLTACTLEKCARHLRKSCSTGGSTKPILTIIHLN